MLVEGTSDQRAVAALAERLGRNLAAEGISIVPMGGAQAIGRFLAHFGPEGLDVRLAGLCDAGEERDFERALERAGLGSGLNRAGMEALGFYVCERNLEDELVRALGADAVEALLDAQGELGSFRTYQKQPAHRHRTTEDQLWGFMWNRKIRYADLARRGARPRPGTPAARPRARARLASRRPSRCASRTSARRPLSMRRIVAIDLLADPDRLGELDLVMLRNDA